MTVIAFPSHAEPSSRIEVTACAHLSLPLLGAVWAQRERHPRGDTFFDTDLDIREDGINSGISIYIGRWEFVLDRAVRFVDDTAGGEHSSERHWVGPALPWLYLAVPVLVTLGAAKALAGVAARAAWRGVKRDRAVKRGAA